MLVPKLVGWWRFSCRDLGNTPEALRVRLTSVSDTKTITPAAKAIDAARRGVWLLVMNITVQAPIGAHRPARHTRANATPRVAPLGLAMTDGAADQAACSTRNRADAVPRAVTSDVQRLRAL